MKSLKRAFAALLLLVTLSVTGTPLAQAEGTNLTDELKALVADLSTEQQAALLLLITQLKGGGAAEAGADTAAADKSDKDKIMDTINKVKTALETKNIDLLLEAFSPDFEHPQVGGKEEARAMLTMGLQSGYADDGEVSIEDVEIEIDEAAGTATAYPLDLSSPAGSVAAELEFKKEADGSWLISTLFVDGV